jgi:hypothetical protein
MAEINLIGNGFGEVTAVTGNKTLAEGDSGVVQNVTATATITLPATGANFAFTVRVGALGLTVTVAPNAADKIMGNGFTSADNKALIFTNQPVGSFVSLIYGGVDGWVVTEISGVATRQG